MTVPDRMSKLRGELEKVLDRIVSDPAYRRELLDNPRAALGAVGLDLPGGPEVAAYMAPGCPGKSCQQTCNVSCSHASPKTCRYSCSFTCEGNATAGFAAG